MATALETKDLCKRFTLHEKESGFVGSLRSLFHPKTRIVEAVGGVSLRAEEGELLAFIGPNGAGKSTTIKMLTGILHPSAGEAKVLGLVPWKQRQQLAYSIGSVFGQKSQLWLHLPPADTFRLLGRIYELPEKEFAMRVDKLVELFDLDELMKVPVRKLSLGQRMRCEIAAALVHSPRVIFLDEPTIGLDVIAKQKIRDLILEANREEGVTIFLTSHDAGDIERLCKRVIIIDRGQVLLDRDVQSLKRSHHFKVRTVGVRLSRAFGDFVLDGVETVKQKGTGMKLRVDTERVPIDRVIAELRERGGIEDITVRTPSLEEIIGQIYLSKGEVVGAGPPEAVGPSSKQVASKEDPDEDTRRSDS